MVLALLAAIVVFGALYLTDAIKLSQAGIGVGAVAAIAAILVLLK